MRKGYFTLQLVNQETGLVYQEHVFNNDRESSSTMTYAEVQHQSPFFIRLLSISPDDVLIDLEIDGQEVERRRRINSGIVYRLGRLQKKKDIHQMRVFDSSILEDHDKTGTINAKLYALNESLTCMDDNNDDSFVLVEERTSDEDDFIVVIPSPTKEAKPESTISSSLGLVATMTMKYCTSEFLYRRGIVPQPLDYSEDEEHDLHSIRKLRIDYVFDGQIIDTKQVDVVSVST